MQHPFVALAPEYDRLLAAMVVTRRSAVDDAARRLIGFIDAGRYKAGCDATGVPQAWAAASFEREADSNFRLNPAQGAPLHERSRLVPHNGPFADWTSAQIAAYRIDHLDAVGRANWIWARACYEGEAFNGFGPRAHGVHTGYLWAGTNIYTHGKYVADRVWSAVEEDAQLGIIPVMKRIVELRPDLDLAATAPRQAEDRPGHVPPPEPLPEGLHDAILLQRALNSLPADCFAPGFHCQLPLVEDDSFGRATRRAVEAFQAAHELKVDGVAGPETWAVINKLA